MEMLQLDFVRNAFIAGGCIALAAGLVGYFVVLRNQVFTSDALGHIRARGFRLLATSSHKGESLAMADLASKVAIFIGNEGAGLDKKLLAQMDGLIMIPHSERVESLNAGIAASIILYEAARQRRS